MPVNDELEDRISSKYAKKVADHISYQQRFDHKAQDTVRRALIGGESYTFIEWDPDLGPEMKESKEAREKGEKLEVVLDGEKKKDSIGRQKYIPEDESVNIGDVKLMNVMGHRVYLERKREFDESKYLFREDIEDTALLKKRYKSKEDKIHEDRDKSYFDYSKFEDSKLENETFKYVFYHRKSREVPKGRYIVFTETAILENRDLQYSHGDFPAERLVDIEIPEELQWIVTGKHT